MDGPLITVCAAQTLDDKWQGQQHLNPHRASALWRAKQIDRITELTELTGNGGKGGWRSVTADTMSAFFTWTRGYEPCTR